MKTAVVAIGGNAILRAGQKGSAVEQMANLEESCARIIEMICQGYDVVLTHGNGPQVGNILLQNEAIESLVPAMPIDVCVSESQGLIGYMFQQTLANALERRGLRKSVASVITQVVVSEDDPAFKDPSKPIGQYFKKAEALRLIKEKGWTMDEDKARGGYRRLVPSPKPLDIVEKDIIKRLVFSEDGGYIVIAAGGGGVPVVRTKAGYKGVEAVVDKDLAASVLATSIGEKLFIMLTDVSQVFLNYGKLEQQAIAKVSANKLREFYEAGHFPAGSMGPKIEAALAFLEKGGSEVIITSPEMLMRALAGKAGTRITT